MRRVVVALSLAAVLGGCVDHSLPDLPPVFRIDGLRYWWEGDALVVNVTFTNDANFTPGQDAMMPGISIRLVEENIVSGRPGEQTMLKGYLPSDHVLVTFSPFPGTAWKARWTSSANTGPILLPPGTTKSIEVEIHPQAQYSTGKDGYYYIDVGLPSFYPNEMRQPDQGVEDAEYVTGCFNHSVPEFYGISPGADCRIWDCTGAWTLDEYQLSDVHPHHSCTLTHAKGPY